MLTAPLISCIGILIICIINIAWQPPKLSGSEATNGDIEDRIDRVYGFAHACIDYAFFKLLAVVGVIVVTHLCICFFTPRHPNAGSAVDSQSVQAPIGDEEEGVPGDGVQDERQDLADPS